MIVYVVTHASEDWKIVEGVYASKDSAIDSQIEEHDNIKWEDDYFEGRFDLPMNSWPIEISIFAMEVIP